jgi:threonine dehydrogenase-like Zn-dependent dehydrogenase
MESRSSRLLAADEELVLALAKQAAAFAGLTVVSSSLIPRDTLHMIAEGKIDCAPIVTGTVGLDGVDNAFTALKDPEKHAKTLIDPSSTATAPKS